MKLKCSRLTSGDPRVENVKTEQQTHATINAMHVPTLYLDTSTIGGYFDDEWKDATQEL